ncbi:MAG: iron-containing alcohol dehydrogenase [Pirellulaceae bacterium]|nr:iron-containing alcohol dehydrogenase [Pirellulaceae bacterium]
MPATWNFFTSGQLVFGPGSIEQLAEFAARRQLKRILVVTDRRLQEAGVVSVLEEQLAKAPLEFSIFDEGIAEPSLETASQALAMAQQWQPDSVLGLGGGSNMDLAKIVATVLAHGGTPADYFGFDQVPGPVLPLICVPTTAGTGSEVSHAAVLTDTENEIKVSTMSNYLRPDLALVDPVLTYSCPAQVAADSGIDALTHAIEAYTAVDYDKMEIPAGESSSYTGRQPLGDCLAEKAISLTGQHLVNAVTDPENHQARDAMSLAATLAGMAFSNCGVALVHALEYPLGGTLHCSHGAGNGLLLPYVMRFNLPEREATMGRIARLLGCEIEGMEPSAAAEQAIVHVEQMRQTIGIPHRIRELGAREEQLAGFAEKSFAIKRLQWVNPRRSTYEDLLGILQDAF